MNGHNMKGGNVLSGDGSAAWENASTYPPWEGTTLGAQFPGEGINLPINKYYFYRGPCGWSTDMICYGPVARITYSGPGTPNTYR